MALLDYSPNYDLENVIYQSFVVFFFYHGIALLFFIFCLVEMYRLELCSRKWRKTGQNHCPASRRLKLN